MLLRPGEPQIPGLGLVRVGVAGEVVCVGLPARKPLIVLGVARPTKAHMEVLFGSRLASGLPSSFPQ